MSGMEKWVLLEESWHQIDNTWVFGNGWLVKTACCDITRSWDQTFLDRLPGGDEVVCSRVGVVAAPPEPEPEPVPAPRKARKTK